ncbi:MAG: hypothetical protein M0R80_26090 [Proteobacteria bacterium]|jgi:hypothetical protein|nr:hypothetical protein [Pseudomonadota bacterium]
MQITVEGIPNLTKNIAHLSQFRDQIPYAISRAGNALLWEVRTNTVEVLAQERFNIRKRNFLTSRDTGFNVDSMNKRNLVGRVGSPDERWAIHEYGGIKKPKGRNIAIPQREEIGVDLASIIPKSKRPKALLGRARTFIQTMPSGKTGIWQRTGNARRPIRLLYAFGKQATIRAMFGFTANAKDIVEKKYTRFFGEELAKAIATRK